MHQSFAPQPPSNSPGEWWGHSRSVKFPDTGAKILSEVPAPWYSVVQTKDPCVEFKSSHQTLRSISKRRKRERELRK